MWGGNGLANPAQVAIKYRDAAGNTITPDVTYTGSGRTDYSVSSVNGCCFLGATQTFTPPAIPGYVTPDAKTPTLEAGSNTVTFTYQPLWSLMKRSDKTQYGIGETLKHTFRATNDSLMAIHDVSIAEDQFSGTGTPAPSLKGVPCRVIPAASGTGTTVTNGQVVLVSGDSLECQASYVTTQADVAAGRITNTATAVGTLPGHPARAP